jgi:hypothetical protein
VSDNELLLNVAREADYWDFAVRIGADIDPDEQSPEIGARYFTRSRTSSRRLRSTRTGKSEGRSSPPSTLTKRRSPATS